MADRLQIYHPIACGMAVFFRYHVAVFYRKTDLPCPT